MIRDGKGRFVKGHPNVGAGRKPKSHEENLLKAVSDSCSPQDIKDIMDALIRKAKHGSIAAAKVVLAYAVGMPVQRTELTGESGGALRIQVIYDDYPNQDAPSAPGPG